MKKFLLLSAFLLLLSSCTRTPSQELQDVICEKHDMFPASVGPGLVIDDIEMNDSTVVYHFVVNDAMLCIDTVLQNVSMNGRDNILASFDELSDEDLYFFSLVRDAGMNLVWRFEGSTTRRSTEVFVLNREISDALADSHVK